MPNLYFIPIGRLGNNIIQYMAARLLSRAFGHTLVQWRSDIQNPIEIADNSDSEFGFSWLWFREYVLENGFEGLRSHPIAKRDIVLNGFFQQSDIYIAHRDWLRSLFTEENKDKLNFDVSVCDLISAKPRGQKTGTITLHLRLGDFQMAPGKCLVLHPRIYLKILRKLMPAPLEIITHPLKKREEEFYLSLFHPLAPTFSTSYSELEDHATLRGAKRAFFSNSTFAWTAAFLGDAEERYMPITDYFSDTQNLGSISPSDKIMQTEFLCLEQFSVTPYPKAFSGELFQGLCDAIIIDKEKEEYHKYLDSYISRDKWLFLEDNWASQANVEILCLYADKVPESCERITKDIFPNLGVILIHNGDTTPCEKSMMNLLERFPAVEIFAQNNVLSHPRIHSLPMGIQNSMWREYTLENTQNMNKQYFAFASHFGETHPARKELCDWLAIHPFPGLYRGVKCSQIDYWKTLFLSYFTFCPPGNAHDTHRLWESFMSCSIPIVLKTPFIERLCETCPDLPMVVVDSFCKEDWYSFLLNHVDKFKNIPSSLYIEYWRELFNTYRVLAHA
jgi:hypothetical protein